MPESAEQPAGPEQRTPEPQGRFAGMPYDWRKPTVARTATRWWSPGEPRLFTPKAFGWGYGLNFYWLIHPVRYFRNRS